MNTRGISKACSKRFRPGGGWDAAYAPCVKRREGSNPSAGYVAQHAPARWFVCAQNGAQARRRLLEYDFSLVAINTPLNDEFGIDLAVTAAEKSYAGVLLLVRSEQADEGLSEEVEQSGVVVVPKPVSREYFHQAARLAVASHRRLMNVQKEKRQTAGSNRGNPPGQPREIHPDGKAGHERSAGTPVCGKNRDGPADHPRGNRQGDTGPERMTEGKHEGFRL